MFSDDPSSVPRDFGIHAVAFDNVREVVDLAKLNLYRSLPEVFVAMESVYRAASCGAR